MDFQYFQSSNIWSFFLMFNPCCIFPLPTVHMYTQAAWSHGLGWSSWLPVSERCICFRQYLRSQGISRDLQGWKFPWKAPRPHAMICHAPSKKWWTSHEIGSILRIFRYFRYFKMSRVRISQSQSHRYVGSSLIQGFHGLPHCTSHCNGSTSPNAAAWSMFVRSWWVTGGWKLCACAKLAALNVPKV